MFFGTARGAGTDKLKHGKKRKSAALKPEPDVLETTDEVVQMSKMPLAEDAIAPVL